jgi:hypothetical protein
MIFLANAAARALPEPGGTVHMNEALLLTDARNAASLRHDVELVVDAASVDGGDLPELELDVDATGVVAVRPARFRRTGFTEEEAAALVPGLVRLLLYGGPGADFARSLARLCPIGTVPPSLRGFEEGDA